MRKLFAGIASMARKFGWLTILPVLAVCSADHPTTIVAGAPGAVTNLSVQSKTAASATLTFTEVDNGMGQPAKYNVRYAVAPISWASATTVVAGSCASLIGSAVGAALSCTVQGLSPATDYNFQVMAYRGTLDAQAVFGQVSNVADATTDGNGPPTPVVTTVSVSPATASVQVGSTATLQATVKDQNGNTMAGQTVTWSTNNAGVATVDANGLVSGIAAGSATITAASSGKTGSATITVTTTPPPPPVVTTVSVSPTSASVGVGATTTLSATVKDQNGNTMSGQTVTWSSNNTAAATVNANGVVTGVAAGSASITATSSGKSGSASVTVTAPPPPPVVTTVTVSPASASVNVGSTTSLTATVKDQNGNTMSGQTVTWSSNNTGSATVNASGVVTGVAAGSATITATSSGKSGTSSITVTQPPPPGGGTLLFQENFEDANIGSRGWYDNTTVSLSTTEHISGSTASAEYHWTSGSTTPVNGAAQRHLFTASNSVYVSYYVKYSANYVGSGQSYQPHEFYILSTLDGQYDGPSNNYMTIYIEQNYQNGGKPVINMQDNKNINTSMGSLPNNLVNVTENRSTGGCNGMAETNMYSECFVNFGSWYNLKNQVGPVTFQPNPGPGYKNDWNFVEVYVQLNTVTNGKGNGDGIMQYWFNGQLVIDRHDVLYRTAQRATLQLNQFIIAPYIGDGSPVDQYMWVDNLRVATGRIP